MSYRIMSYRTKNPYKVYWDAVGRPRKLSMGAMKTIQKEYSLGATIKKLSDEWGVSKSTIEKVVYFTRKES